jgi:hypothetical protein
VRSSLALLAALGAALVLAGAGDGAGDDRSEPGLDPNVALEIRAARPAQTLPGALRTVASETDSPALARAIRTGLEVPADAGIEPERPLSQFSYLILRIEPSCPPPAVLACRPGVRVIAVLREPATPPLQRELRTVFVAWLRAAGFEALRTPEDGDAGEKTGRITSRGETVAHWRIDGLVLEVATGGLALSGERPKRIPPFQIETNPETITELFNG